MLGGYAGKMLFVDLSNNSIEEKELTEEMAEKFLGGYGIGARILYDMMPKGADPLGPENVLGFITGPLTGTKALFGGRYTIVHKSPVTGGWNDANSGGYFGPELKKAGYDAVFIKGIAEKPVYLWINDGKVEIRDATHLWGMDAKEVWEALKEETGEEKVRVVAIGPAGERKALISCPINDGHRAPGRGGGGAVMGSKRLKAIAVRGTKEVKVADPERLLEINKKVAANVRESKFAQMFGMLGTGALTTASALSGDSPVKNWGGVGVVDFGQENAEKVGADKLEKYKVRKYACFNCPIGCGAELEVNDGKWPLGETERPEYETAAAFGSTLLCHDMDAILKCNEICNRSGLDTISAGMTIARAMECYNEGVLTREELDGIDLTWGNGEAIVALMEKMAKGEGVGAILANGSQYAAKYFGKGEEYLQTASGIELPMHDPRFAPGLARTYKYDPTPGRHVKGGAGNLQMTGEYQGDKYDYNGTGPIDVSATTFTEVMNSSGICMLSSFVVPPAVPPEVLYEYIEAVTGREFKEEDSYNIGLRIYTMRHAFNLREGITPKDLTISDRAIGKPPLTAGPLEGVTVDLDKLARNFFEELNWDMETGKPSVDFLQRLELDKVVEDLYGEKAS